MFFPKSIKYNFSYQFKFLTYCKVSLFVFNKRDRTNLLRLKFWIKTVFQFKEKLIMRFNY